MPVKAIWGILLAWVTPPTATVLAVSDGPSSATTFWLNTRSLALLSAVSGLEASSSTMILIGRPLMPPLALMSFSASSRPLRSGPPRPAPAPVIETMAPILIGSPEVWALAAQAVSPTSAAAPVNRANEDRDIGVSSGTLLLFVLLSFCLVLLCLVERVSDAREAAAVPPCRGHADRTGSPARRSRTSRARWRHGRRETAAAWCWTCTGRSSRRRPSGC